MPSKSKNQYLIELLKYFYPIHYQIGMVVEEAMRGPLSHREAALLWLLYAEGENGASLPRKFVVARLNNWFDATSSNVTKIIARLSAPEVALVKITNELGSARDKRVELTMQGSAFVQDMFNKGATHPLMMGMSVNQIRANIELYKDLLPRDINLYMPNDRVK